MLNLLNLFSIPHPDLVFLKSFALRYWEKKKKATLKIRLVGLDLRGGFV